MLLVTPLNKKDFLALRIMLYLRASIPANCSFALPDSFYELFSSSSFLISPFLSVSVSA